MVIDSLFHKPDIVGGEIVLNWYPARSDNSYGEQILRHIYPGVVTNYIRGYRDGTWSNWQKYVSNSDFRSSDLGTADLNSIKNPGNYVQTSSARATTANHYPVNYAGYLEVVGNVDLTWVMQRYTVYNTGAVYIRCLYDNGWYNWSDPK